MCCGRSGGRAGGGDSTAGFGLQACILSFSSDPLVEISTYRMESASISIRTVKHCGASRCEFDGLDASGCTNPAPFGNHGSGLATDNVHGTNQKQEAFSARTHRRQPAERKFALPSVPTSGNQRHLRLRAPCRTRAAAVVNGRLAGTPTGSPPEAAVRTVERPSSKLSPRATQAEWCHHLARAPASAATLGSTQAYERGKGQRERRPRELWSHRATSVINNPEPAK
jgi:hypothetical protein